MKRIIYFLIGIFFIPAIISIAQNNNINISEKYSQVRIFTVNENDFKRIMDAGLLIDHAVRKSEYTDAWLSKAEIEMLKKSGVAYNVLVNDWKEYYDNLPKMSNAEMQNRINESAELFGVSHSIYGSMGGFLTYGEVANKLDSMRLQYPELISVKFSIGSTIQARQIWTVRVTKNPDATTGKPEVWYHAMIHAREPESMEHQIYFMYWLFENYNIDPIATYILNNRELYFTPILNPDGYEYNRSTNPNGGGLWRKNRRSNTGGSFGIDLNRNYGIYQYWNSSNGGSSTSPSSDTYRGTSPFSEPETQAVMNFVNGRNIQVVQGAHTYGNYIIKPWAWQDPIPTPDDFKFNEYLNDMSNSNNYTTGTPSQTVGYMVRGGADDWYYNDSVHASHNIIAMTPETGTTGFWPTQAEIIPLAEGMLFSNQYFALIAGAFVYPVSKNFNKQVYTSGESGTLKINFKNKGLAIAQNVKIECTTDSYYLNIPITYFNYSSLTSFQSDSSTIGFTISPAVPNNSAIPVHIKFRQNDSSMVYQETKYILIGNGALTLADSAENGFGKWTTNAGWTTTTAQFHTPTRSFTESPSGNYGNNINNSMTLSASLNVSTLPVTFLSFWHRYATEPGYDFCYIEVSSNNGTSWQTVTAYDGTLTTWTQQVLDITSYANASSQLKIRFRLQSDGGVVADGWYVDDIKITNYNPLINSVVTNLNLTLAQEGFYDSDLNSLSLKDTVSVYLKNTIAPYLIADSAKGTIDSLTLTGNFGFRNAPTGNYYIVVHHRNSVETWSKPGGEAYIFGGNLNYDLTTSSAQAYGNNLQLVGAKYCIYTGDINQDGSVDLDDLLSAFNDAGNFVTGYVNSDVTGDYGVDLDDILLVYNNTSIFITRITPP